jgi:surface protein
VSGSLTGFGQDLLKFGQQLGGAQYLRAVRSFGELGITALTFAFYGSTNLIDVPSTLPTTVSDMSGMFYGATSFNQSLNSWDTGSVTDMSNMFGLATSFNGDVSGWDTGLVTNTFGMFAGASSFNGDVSGWDTSLVTNMSYMFNEASSFNQSLNNWDTGLVSDMSNMFEGASSFNQSLNNWDTGLVSDMSAMFARASSFNGDVSGWDTGLVTLMWYMFYQASSFNQSLGAWDISAVVHMSYMLDDSALSVDNYDATLNGWADILQAKQSNVVLGAAGLYFSSNASLAHDTLTNSCGINPSNWQINDSGLDPNSLINNNQFLAAIC